MAVPTRAVGAEFQQLCARADLEVELDADFVTTIWNKFAYNITGNTLTTILGQPVNRLPRFKALRKLVTDLIDECVHVGTAEGTAWTPNCRSRRCGCSAATPTPPCRRCTRTGSGRRPLEHDALTGALIRLADRHGIPVPHNQTIYALLEAMDGYRNSGAVDVADRIPEEEEHDQPHQ